MGDLSACPHRQAGADQRSDLSAGHRQAPHEKKTGARNRKITDRARRETRGKEENSFHGKCLCPLDLPANGCRLMGDPFSKSLLMSHPFDLTCSLLYPSLFPDRSLLNPKPKTRPRDATARKIKKAIRRWNWPGWWLTLSRPVTIHSSQILHSADTNSVRTSSRVLPQKQHFLPLTLMA